MGDLSKKRLSSAAGAPPDAATANLAAANADLSADALQSFMFRGEIRDMSKDPFADARAKIKLDDSPSSGPAEAKLTVVEFSDFECPHCQEMYSVLQQIEPEFPQVRFVYKNFPLEQIQPGAMLPTRSNPAWST